LAEGAPAALAVDDRVVAAGLLTIVYEIRKSKGDVKQDECRREVLDILRREAGRGALDAKTLATHSNFAGLRGDAEFDALVKDAAK
jgi:hypothetical protein